MEVLLQGGRKRLVHSELACLLDDLLNVVCWEHSCIQCSLQCSGEPPFIDSLAVNNDVSLLEADLKLNL